MNAMTLTRRNIRVRHPDRGYVMFHGHECRGIAVVPHELIDEAATEQAIAAWSLDEYEAEQPAPIVRYGFVLVHAATGYTLTPKGWLLNDLDQVRVCVRTLLDRHGDQFEGSAKDIERLSKSVLEAHRQAGAFTGRYHFLTALNAAIDEDKYQAGLAELRKSRPTAEFIERTTR